MSLAMAIAHAKPYLDAMQSGTNILNGQDPFMSTPGWSTGAPTAPATGGLPSLPAMLNHGQDPAAIDPMFSGGASLPSSGSQAASVIGALPSAAPVAAIPAAVSPAGGLGNPIYTAPAWTSQVHGIPGSGQSIYDSIAKSNYDQLNFNHYAAPSGSNLPFIGSHYQGTQPGYWYDPMMDRYVVNQNSLVDTQGKQGAIANQTNLAQRYGLLPQTPSTGEQLLNTLLGAGGLGLGNYLGKKAGTSGSSLLDSIFGNLTSSSPSSSFGGADPSTLTNGLSDPSTGLSLFGDTSSGGFDGSSFANPLENIIGAKLGLNKGTTNVANLATDYFSGNAPQGIMDTIKDGPGLISDLADNITSLF